MYINSLLFELTFSSYDPELRERVLAMTKEMTNLELWSELEKLDPVRANQLSVNDVHRVSRAIEVSLNGKSNSTFEEFEKKRYDADIYVLSGDRAEIYERINKRVDIMLENGLIEEVKRLVEKGSSSSDQAFGAIAYKEIYDYLTGRCDYDKTIDLIKQRSRNYAKRQLTWCRKYYPEAVWLDYKDKENNLKKIIERYGKL